MTELLKWVFIGISCIAILMIVFIMDYYKRTVARKYSEIIVSASNNKLAYVMCAIFGVFIYNIVKNGMLPHYYLTFFVLVGFSCYLIINFNTLVFSDHGIFENSFSKGEIKNIPWTEVTSLVLVQRTRKERKRNLCTVYISRGEEVNKMKKYYFSKSFISRKIDYFYNIHGFKYFR